MLPPFLGALLLVATALAVSLAAVVAVVARARGAARLTRLAIAGGAASAGVYVIFWALGFALSDTTVLPPGSVVRFCGLDCHLQVSVTGARAAEPGLGVTVRFASNAVRAPEWPGKLRFRLRDEAGRELAPWNPLPDTPLAAGTERSFELLFAADARPRGATLLVSWGNGLDLLVPGAGNSLVQRKRRLALPL